MLTCFGCLTQMYMTFLNWRFSKRLEHYAHMKGPYYGGEKIMELIWGHGSKFHVRRLGLDYTDLGFVCVFLLFSFMCTGYYNA